MTNRHLVHMLEQTHAKNAKSKDKGTAPKEEGSQQLTYTSGSHPTMILMVNVTYYELWKKDHSVALTDVVDSFDLLKYESGHSGIISKPSKSELDATFGTTKVDKIIHFMLEHGALQHKAI